MLLLAFQVQRNSILIFWRRNSHSKKQAKSLSDKQLYPSEQPTLSGPGQPYRDTPSEMRFSRIIDGSQR
jgi:hypothetical protein